MLPLCPSGSMSTQCPVFHAASLPALSCCRPVLLPVSSSLLLKQGQCGPRRAPPSFLCSARKSCSGDLSFISPGCCLPAWGCEGIV